MKVAQYHLAQADADWKEEHNSNEGGESIDIRHHQIDQPTSQEQT